jgi:AcrR family transcriptional regulator
MYNGALMNEYGLRERKKRQTRDSIAMAAMGLFQARGFDDVTVAEVAHAAGVSEKTVFNHFPSKEDLVFFRADDRLVERADALRNRPPGVPVSRLFAAETMAFLDMIEAGRSEVYMTVPRLVRASPALRARLLVAFEHEAVELTAAVSGDDDDLEAAAVIRALVWAHRVIQRVAMQRAMQGEDHVTIAEELRAEAVRVYARLDAGLARYGG